jgi:hypothetical protein
MKYGRRRVARSLKRRRQIRTLPNFYISNGTLTIGGTLINNGGDFDISPTAFPSDSATVSAAGLDNTGGSVFITGGSSPGPAERATLNITFAASDSGLMTITGNAVFNGVVTILGGGTIYIYDLGTLGGSIVDAGASEYVWPGGTTDNPTINGGVLDLFAGGIVEGSITFESGGGTLEINGDAMPTNQIANFAAGDIIIPFDSEFVEIR